MRKLYKFFTNLATWMGKNTPRADYLAHDFWGNHLWSNVGVILAILTALIKPVLGLLLIPILTTVIPALSKEKADGEDNNGDGELDGNRDYKDILWTLASLPMKLILLTIIILLLQ